MRALLGTASGQAHAALAARAFTSIPVIDVSPLVKPGSEQHGGDVKKQLEVAQQLHTAAKDVGFFYCQHSGKALSRHAKVSSLNPSRMTWRCTVSGKAAGTHSIGQLLFGVKTTQRGIPQVCLRRPAVMHAARLTSASSICGSLLLHQLSLLRRAVV